MEVALNAVADSDVAGQQRESAEADSKHEKIKHGSAP